MIPRTIEKSVPSATIGSVFLIGSQSAVADRLLRAQRAAQVAVREVAEVEPVLLPLRLVEPELLALVRLELRRALPAAQRRDGVAGERPEEDEVERDRDEDGRERRRAPA